MKALFIEAKYKGKIELNERIVEKLPDKIGLVATVQFADRIGEIKNQLKGKEIFTAKGRQKYVAQVLGCDISAAEKIKEGVDAFLYIGSGNFHPLGIALKTKKPIYCFNPITNVFSKIKNEDVEKHKKNRKGALIKFLSSDNIGILVSTKPGQSNLKKALELKNKLKNKNCYIFSFDTLNTNDLENFPFIECWVNTACPRIEGRNIINLEEITSC